MLLSSTDFVVLYHVGCNDGSAAAWCAKMVLGDATIYKAHQYGWKLPREIDGKHLILVDLSLPMEQIQELLDTKRVRSVMVVDHHKTALPLVDNYAEVRTFNDYLLALHKGDAGCMQFIKMNRSGAVLAWMFFNNRVEEEFKDNEDLSAQMPSILSYIEDYDLWHHKLTGTQAVNRWLIDGGLSIERIGKSMDSEGKLLDTVLHVGEAFHDYNQRIVKSVIRDYIQEIDYFGEKVALINSPHHLRNDVGDALVDKYLFVACYTERSERTVFSLRAKKGKFDVTTVAERFGGGGHAEAGAFSIPVGMSPRVTIRPTLFQRVLRRLCVRF